MRSINIWRVHLSAGIQSLSSGWRATGIQRLCRRGIRISFHRLFVCMAIAA
jgi:hypothetical protein